MQRNASKVTKGALRAKTERARQRAAIRNLARRAESGTLGINFHTHIGQPVLDSAGEPVYERVPSVHGNGRYRIKYERLGLSGWRNVRVKTDGAGKWMDAGDLRLGNRSQRRQMAKEARARQRDLARGGS